MKKKLLGCILCLLCLLQVTAFAAEATKYNGSVYKLGRGVTNTALCAFDLARSIENAVDDYGVAPGIFVGTFHGIGRTITRLGVGLYDMFTFCFGDPNEYYMEPEFVLGKEE